MIFVGLDWAEATDAVCVLDEAGVVLLKTTIEETVSGCSTLQSQLAGFASSPNEVVVGIETDRGMVVRLLLAAGYRLYAINPLAASRYRDRHHSSGAKSDPGDAKMLADLVRTDRHNHRLLKPASDEVEALQLVTRLHQRLVWDRQRHANRLRSVLREFYPQMKAAVGTDLSSPVALALLARAPTPDQGQRLTRAQLEAILRRAGASRNIPARAQALHAALQIPAPAELPVVLATAYGFEVRALVQIITALSTQIDGAEKELTAQFEVHPDAEIIESLPGLGSVLGARILAESGDDPNRYANSKARKSAAGTAPITRTSGLKCSVTWRHATNRWLSSACMRWAFCSIQTSPGAAAYYQAHRGRGHTHTQALRAVANRWVGILHGCLRHRTHYDERTAWPALAAATHDEPTSNQTKSLKMTGSRNGSHATLAASA